MLRTFDEHIKRKNVSLDGVWKFKIDEERKGKDESWHFGLKDAKTVVVPSVWNTDLKLLGYEGQSFYERDFFFEGGTLRLSFGAVMTSAEVFLDGELLGTHYGGFSQFDFIVKNVSMGYHKLVVLVDNSFDKQSIPQKKVDWYHYGGIVRGIDAEKLCGISILNYRLEYDLSVDSKTAACRMYIELYNADGKNGCGTVKFSVGDKLNILGPLGNGFSVDKEYKHPVVIGGGIGIYPLLQTAKKLGNADAILGFRNKDFVTLEDDFTKACNNLYITTDDGSYVRKGLVTEVLNEVIYLCLRSYAYA